MKDALGAPQSLLLLGGTSEIGLAIVRELAGSRLEKVVLAGRNESALDAAVADVRAAGVGDVATAVFDADATESHRAVIDDVFATHGDLDVVVLAAGVLGDQQEAEDRPEVAVELLHTNFVGAASAALHVARHLRRQGHGTLVVLSSVAGERARRTNFVYGASKAGLDALSQGLGDSLAGSGARVLVVRPGFVRTRMTAGLPDAPLATDPSAVARVVTGAIASGKETVWAPAAMRPVMMVLRHLPRPLFRRLRV
jgi:decaprenylphospho-beta-D-erythro-pentofuranosid-2-ulose 2-reductase